MSYDLFKDYVPAISHNKKKLMDSGDDQWEKKYLPFLINRNFSNFQDSLMQAQEMNIHHTADHKMQFDFLLNSIRPRKRFAKWLKASKVKDIEYVKEFYGYNNEKAKVALTILNDEQIATIKQKLEKGGRNGRG